MKPAGYGGVRVGLEFHQRLATSKLFCDCSSDLKEAQPITAVSRRLRPVAGETGEIDVAVREEFARGSQFSYQVFRDETCLVELDEEPPHEANAKALEVALEISLLLGCEVFDEIHVMRKTVLDGSAVSGFQRTAMVAGGGSLNLPEGSVPITGVYLEEEASGIIGKKEEGIYRLDRLGIPLVEISTGIMQDASPAQVKDAALRLGRLLRVTGKVGRGIGSIRQDVNISVEGGDRVEIKGFQEIDVLERAVEYEARRQRRLIALRELLRERGLKPISPRITEFTKHFMSNESFIGRSVREGGKVLGFLLPGFAGCFSFELTPGRHFGSELADHAKTFGFGGMVDSDEKPEKYGAQKPFVEIGAEHSLSPEDAFLFLVGKDETRLKATLGAIADRINFAFKGVPRETRQPLPDGNSAYMRPLPGASRLYPETDLKPIIVSKEHLDVVREKLPRKPEQIFEELTEKYRLSDDLAAALVTSPQLPLFLELADWATNPTIVATTLLNTITTLRREGLNVSALTPDVFRQLFVALKENRIAKEAIPQLLRAQASAPRVAFGNVLKTAGAVSFPLSSLDQRIRQLVKQKPDLGGQRAFNVLMGDLMKEFRGKVDGSLIAKKLKEALGL
ncbi:Glu-tRNA(Gln) amidotransferase subunit GatE [Candidatus Micrarchaeota archaeon]|nr:Glu-tRNA(Gln) amidotransferase subunit GatE [Candidatus Micrarchaeota archaeon]